MTFARIIEEVSKADGAVGWCLMIGGGYGMFGGHLPEESAREIHGSDPNVITAGAFRPSGQAIVVHGAGLRGTGSHDYVVSDLFVPATRSLSFREAPVQSGPLYPLPTIAIFTPWIAAVPLGIARHAIDALVELAGVKSATRSQNPLNQLATVQTDLARAEALLRSGRAFLYETLEEAWQVVITGDSLSSEQRSMLWLAATHATVAATQAVELMFNAGGSSSVYTSSPLERCLRYIRTAGQHLGVVPSNYEMVGQALLGFDMSQTPLLRLDDRGAG